MSAIDARRYYSPASVEAANVRQVLIDAGMLRPAPLDLPPGLTVLRLPPERVVFRLDADSRTIAARHIEQGDHGRREMAIPGSDLRWMDRRRR